jgi:hypothetical protein
MSITLNELWPLTTRLQPLCSTVPYYGTTLHHAMPARLYGLSASMMKIGKAVERSTTDISTTVRHN